MSEILQKYLDVIPTLLEAIDLDAMMAITDGQKFLGYFPGKTMIADIQVNNTLSQEDPMYKSFRTGRKIVSDVPEKIYGFPFKSVCMPIREEGKVVGCLGFAVSLEKDQKVTVSFQEMQEKINMMHKDIDNISNFTSKVDLEVDTFSRLLNNISENFIGMKKSAEGIKSIASQSNILSLNASIEAARAGEQGRGFAIVAKQMQEHSNSTKHSSEEVITILNNISKNVNEVNENLNSLKVSFSEQGTAIYNMVSTLEELKTLSNSLAKYINSN